MKILKICVMVLGLVFMSSAAFCSQPAEIDDATKELCNKIMVEMYEDILKEVENYDELSQFDENVFYENKEGIYTIVYHFRDSEDKSKKTYFGFGVTIDGIEDKTFKVKRGLFAYSFPLLGVKISGYQLRERQRSKFKIMPLIEKYGARLSDYQQQYLPLRLYIRPLKDSYRVKESVDFEVILKNTGKFNLKVYELSEKSLYITINDRIWGTPPNKPVRIRKRRVPLLAGESLSLVLRGQSFQFPKDVRIYAIYRMNIDGVNPSAELDVKLTK